MSSTFGNAIYLDFSQDFQTLFPPELFKKNYEKKLYGQLFNSNFDTLKYYFFSILLNWVNLAMSID